MKNEEKYPLILFIPGSAWHKQEMYNDIPQYATLAKCGYVVAVMQYRESDIAQFPAQVEDVCNALKFIPSIAENFHIDTERIFLMGNSSGGHIAMMTALFSEHGLCEKITNISGVILESASTDILICSNAPLPPWMQVRPSAVLLGVDKIEGNEELAKKASCEMYITKDIDLPVSKYYDLPLAQLLYAGDDVSGEKWDSRNWNNQKNVRSNMIFTAIKLIEEL